MDMYIKRSGKVFGPFSIEKTKELIKSTPRGKNFDVSTDRKTWVNAISWMSQLMESESNFLTEDKNPVPSMSVLPQESVSLDESVKSVQPVDSSPIPDGQEGEINQESCAGQPPLTNPSTTAKSGRFFLLLCGGFVVLLLLITIIISFSHKPAASSSGVGMLITPSGTVSFKIESHTLPKHKLLKKIKKVTKKEISGEGSNKNALILDLLLYNNSRNTITLTKLSLSSLSTIILKTDLNVYKEGHYDGYCVREEPGNVYAELVNGKSDQKLLSTGHDLLSSGSGLKTLAPGQSRSFRMRVVCRGANFGHCGFGSFNGISLAELDKHTPYINKVMHLVIPIIDIMTDRGTAYRLYADKLCVLSPFPNSSGLLKPLNLFEAFLFPPAEMFARMIDWGVRTHAETIAYNCAKEEGRVPSGFDPEKVVKYCFNGDLFSPFRPIRKIKPDELTRMFPISNVPDEFTSLRKAHPILWKSLHTELMRLSKGDKTLRITRKAHYLLTHYLLTEIGSTDNATEHPTE